MERILLIEDDQALGRGIALALAGEGREIRVAATLAQGRAALGEEEYALVLLDLNLPDALSGAVSHCGRRKNNH